ncbi:hypothetical protein RISK_003000 [Rhodopirellula islandica]|uniref:Uncharacterized protein n=1 Tax=Rhodopirellula islandica TaxID=595434 RepID=A0A0J1BEJ8_RHOIS|nr:hypothetical protein RISK_003000 [Rhodopirellula islandica]
MQSRPLAASPSNPCVLRTNAMPLRGRAASEHLACASCESSPLQTRLLI